MPVRDDAGYAVVGLDLKFDPETASQFSVHAVDLVDLPAITALLHDLGDEEPFYGIVNNASAFPQDAQIVDNQIRAYSTP